MINPTIIFTGFMATGKSTIGRLLAENLGAQFIDTDDLIRERTGRSIADLFEKEGEPAFRAHERTIAREFSGRRGLVIATGGGLMVDPLNAILLGRDNIVFCLTASPRVILSRLEIDGARRPLMEGPDREDQLARLLSQRAEAYEPFIHFDTTGKEPRQIVAEMASMLRLIENSEEYRHPPIGRIQVRYPGGRYQVTVGSGILSRLETLLDDSRPNVLISDSNVAPLHAHLLDYLDPGTVITVPAGEEHKILSTVRTVYGKLLAGGADRQTTVIALGGGVVGDLAGFAAATFMRGMPFLQCPTTVLAMVDASVGAKTGVDLPEGKNLVGAFKQPRAVAADLNTLRTLSSADFNAGFAEIVKHGLIASPALLEQLETGGISQDGGSGAVWDQSSSEADLLSLIVEAILIKRDVVEADPFESGRRKILNLGHTFAHAIEQVSGYKVRHGQAVAIGLVAAAHLSFQLALGQSHLQGQIEQILTSLNLPIRIPAGLAAGDLLQAMNSDKKKASGRLQFVLIRDVGDVFVSGDVAEAAVYKTLRALTHSVKR